MSSSRAVMVMFLGIFQLDGVKIRSRLILSDEFESWIQACWLGSRDCSENLKLFKRVEFTTLWSLTVTLSVGSVCNWTEKVSLSTPSLTSIDVSGSSLGRLESSAVSLSFLSVRTVTKSLAVSSSRLTALMESIWRSLNLSSSDWTFPKRSSYSLFGPPSTRFSSTSSSTPSR